MVVRTTGQSHLVLLDTGYQFAERNPFWCSAFAGGFLWVSAPGADVTACSRFWGQGGFAWEAEGAAGPGWASLPAAQPGCSVSLQREPHGADLSWSRAEQHCLLPLEATARWVKIQVTTPWGFRRCFLWGPWSYMQALAKLSS